MSVIGKIDPTKTVTIYGAGISGLILAYQLKKNNISVRIKEKSDRSGGKLQTLSTEYGLVEKAANAIYANTPVIELLQELHLKPIRATSTLKRLIYNNGKIQKSPISKWSLIKIILKSLKRIPPSAKKEDATIYDFLSPLLGHELAFNIASSGLYGVYASNSKELHRSTLFKFEDFNSSYRRYFLNWLKDRKTKNETLGKAVSVSFENGIQELIDALTDKLKDNIEFNSTESDIEDNSIICTDSHTAGELLELPLLKSISYQKVSSTTVFCKNEIPELKNSFGVLFSPESDFDCLGVLNNTAIFKRSHKPQVQSYTVISKNEDASNNLRKLYKDLAIIKEETKTWSRGIPVYNYKRIKVISDIEKQLNNNTAIFGNYTGSLSLREIIFEAKRFADSIK